MKSASRPPQLPQKPITAPGLVTSEQWPLSDVSVLGGGLVSAAFICSLLPHTQLAMSIMHEVPHKPQKPSEATTGSVHK